MARSFTDPLLPPITTPTILPNEKAIHSQDPYRFARNSSPCSCDRCLDWVLKLTTATVSTGISRIRHPDSAACCYKNGSVRVAHIVVASDAFKSSSELLVAGEHMPTRSSGMSVYRCAYPRVLTSTDVAAQKRWGKGVSAKEYWLGNGMHMGIFISTELAAFGLTPRDTFLQEGSANPTESWEPDVDPENVVKVLQRVPGWDPAADALIRRAPKGSVIHWSLLWRSLRPEWTSKGGRVVQLGDAVHSSVNTSAAGARLALEDAITLAACLQLSSSAGGPGGAALGARIHNLLRYVVSARELRSEDGLCQLAGPERFHH